MSDIPSNLRKRGYYILDENNNVVCTDSGKPLTFKEKEDAEQYLKDNNISGTVK